MEIKVEPYVEKLQQLFMFSYKFHLDLLRNIQIQVLCKLSSRWSGHMCGGLLLFCGEVIPGTITCKEADGGEKKNLCDNCSSEQQS